MLGGIKYIIAIALCSSVIILASTFLGSDKAKNETDSRVLEEVLALTEISPLERDYCSLWVVVCEGDKTTPRAEKSDKTSPQIETERIIRVVAEQEGIDPNLMVQIAWAESGLNPNVRGRITPRDRGVFQINSYYNPDVSDECSFDVWCASRWTASEIRAGNLWKWQASRAKWGKYEK